MALDAEWIKVLSELWSRVNIRACDGLDRLWDPGGGDKPDIVLSQGPSGMLAKANPDWARRSVWIHSNALGDWTVEASEHMQQLHQVSHAEVGGIMCGGWAVACNQAVRFGEPRVEACERRIRHIVDSVTSGRLTDAVAPPERDDLSYGKAWKIDGSTVLDWNGTLPSARPLSKIRCRSVFTETKWTVRGLSAKELCSAFDVPVDVARAFREWAPSQRHRLPFLKSAPSKLLKAVWDRSEFRVSPTGTKVVEEATEKGQPEAAVPPMASMQEEAEEPVVKETDYSKATKADDAAVPVELWDTKVWNLGLHDDHRRMHFEAKWSERRRQQGWQDWKRTPLDVIREWVAARWKRLVTSSFLRYMRVTFGSSWLKESKARDDCEAGKECIERAAGSTFWAWELGSRPFYWRWPISVRRSIRDGFRVWIQGQLPNNRKPQQVERDADTQLKIRGKVSVVRKRGYIMPGEVRSLTGCFSVKKGEADIRMVYDATKSKLNQAIWTPSFALPSVETLTRQLEGSTWMADLDLGDMFLNFMLDTDLRPYCGVDLKSFFDGEEGDPVSWERWVRCMMGLRSSPYVCVKAMLLATEILWGDRMDPQNAYRWDRVEVNLPGSAAYDPSRTWIAKVRQDSGKIAGNTVTYVDDLRSLGESEQECWHMVHQTGSRVGYLGIQNAPRKTRPPSQKAGAWAGTIAETSINGVGVKCSKEKWERAKGMLVDMKKELLDSGQMVHKALEQKRGFFVHIQRTYPNLTPFIKGMHLTLDGWRPGRDSEMWKQRSAPDLEGYWDSKEDRWVPADLGALKPPQLVIPAPRLKDDLEMLQVLMSAEEPPLRLVRTKNIGVAVYGFVDASGVGFGSSVETAEGLHFRYGLWGRDADDTSSNYKELRNLVEAVEKGVKNGELRNSELFIFTDNSTAEGAYYKGNTGSQLLFELVLRLRMLNMDGNLILHVIHVAGTRMIAQGTDALSRGDLQEGVMVGRRMLEFVPLDKTVFERNGEVLDWIRQWSPDSTIEALTMEEWYTKGHGLRGEKRNSEGIWIPNECTESWYLWAPAPAIADAALEELLTSRHKRSHLNHIFVCPRLMTQLWRKKLHKLSDIVFEVPAGARSFWPRSMHEPLIIGLTFGFVACHPWQLRYSDSVLALGRELREVWKSQERCERSVLRQLCDCQRVLDSLQGSVV